MVNIQKVFSFKILRGLLLLLVAYWLAWNMMHQQKYKESQLYTDYSLEAMAGEKVAEVYQIDLQDDGLSAFPKDLYKYQKLKVLRLNMNKFSYFPDSIAIFKNLEELNLSGGFFSASHWLQVEQNGKKLDSTLLYNQIELLPDAFCELNSLRLLDLHNCKLKELPRHFGKLTNIEKLQVQGNLLYFLPESMVDMGALEYLDASRNRLISLPFEIGKLGLLKKFFLSDNRIEYLPKSIAGLQNLEQLDISSNRLHQVGAAIADLEKLRQLNLSENFIFKVSEKIWEMKSLESLNLSRNHLEILTTKNIENKTLINLDLSENRLTSLPKNLKLEALESLNLSGNPLSKVPEMLVYCNALKMLDLRNTGIIELPEAIKKLPYLKAIYLDNDKPTGVEPIELKNPEIPKVVKGEVLEINTINGVVQLKKVDKK